MAVGKDKIGVLVNMDKELKAKLEQLAKDDGRSLTNLINKILADYVEDTQKQSTLYFLHLLQPSLTILTLIVIHTHFERLWLC